MNELKETGGARIGMANATWPFATLTVTKDQLKLDSGIVGNLVFKPQDIISIEYHNAFISGGVKINHKVTSYNKKVIFWTFKNPHEIIKRIESIGFLENKDPIKSSLKQEIEFSQSKGGFPVKVPFAISVIVLWNILFLLDFMNFFGDKNESIVLGLGAQLALGFVLLTCLLLLLSENFRKQVLKEGRTLEDIRKFLYFLILISGFMFLNITILN